MADIAFIALGSNLGNRAAFLTSARGALSLVRGTRLIAASRIEETPPFGTGAQGAYLNQMVVVRSALPPMELLRALQRIECALGRVRHTRWSARTIDLDIVRFGDMEVDVPTLRLPHPGIASRAFWQRELAELDSLLA